MNILLIGYYGHGNAGDELLCEKSLDLLSECFPKDSVFFGSKTNSFFAIFRSSKIIFGGGGVLQNETSTRSLIYYLSIIVLARFFRKKVMLLSQGIGPIHGNILKVITGYIVSLCHVVSVRDNYSYELIKPYCPHVIAGFDLAFYKASRLHNDSDKEFKSEGKLLVNFRPGDAWELNKEALLEWVHLEKNVTFMIGQKEKDYSESVYKNDDFLMDLFNGVVQKYIAVFSMRYHGCVWAILNQVPCFALVYDEKVYQLAQQFKLAFIDLREKCSVNEIDKSIEIFKNEFPVAKDCFKEIEQSFEELKKVLVENG
jgi:polysaccharide pyruvyl transferase CsaB